MRAYGLDRCFDFIIKERSRFEIVNVIAIEQQLSPRESIILLNEIGCCKIGTIWETILRKVINFYAISNIDDFIINPIYRQCEKMDRRSLAMILMIFFFVHAENFKYIAINPHRKSSLDVPLKKIRQFVRKIYYSSL